MVQGRLCSLHTATVTADTYFPPKKLAATYSHLDPTCTTLCLWAIRITYCVKREKTYPRLGCIESRNMSMFTFPTTSEVGGFDRMTGGLHRSVLGRVPGQRRGTLADRCFTGVRPGVSHSWSTRNLFNSNRL